MDRKNLLKLANLIGEILENEPTDADLDYDETRIEIYDAIHNLKIVMEDAGYNFDEAEIAFDDEFDDIDEDEYY